MIISVENQGSVFPNPSMRTVRADYAHWACGLCTVIVRTMRTDRPDYAHQPSGPSVLLLKRFRSEK